MFLCLNKLSLCLLRGRNKIASLRACFARILLCLGFFIGHLYNKKKVAPIKMRPLYLRGSTTYVENFTF